MSELFAEIRERNIKLDLFPEIPLVFEMTKTEAALITALLDHCRSGRQHDSDFRIALLSLQDKFEDYRDDDGTNRIGFTREKPDGSKKTWTSKSKSFVTIEVQ
jgi:hypothetical protein